MNTFKKSFEIFKEKILILFLVKLIFIVLLFFFLVYAREKLYSYLLMIQQYAPQIMGLESMMQEPSSAGLLELENVLNMIQPIIQRAMIFTYFFVPLAIFLLWCFFGGLIWKLLNEKKTRIKHIFKNFWGFFLKFVIISLPCYLLLILLLYKVWQLVLPSYVGVGIGPSIWQVLIFMVLLFFIFYFAFIFYTLIGKISDVVKTFKKSFVVGIRRFYILIPLFLPLFFLLLLLLGLFFYIYIVFISKIVIVSYLVYAIVSLAIVLLLLLWYKIILKLVLEKY